MDKKRQKRERAEKRERKIKAEEKAKRDRTVSRAIVGLIVVACVGFLAIYYWPSAPAPPEYPVTEQTEAVLRLTIDDIGTGPGQWELVTGPTAREEYSSESPSSETMAATVAAQMNAIGAGEFAILHDADGIWQVASRWGMLDKLETKANSVAAPSEPLAPDDIPSWIEGLGGSYSESRIELAYSDITDAGLRHLVGMNKLTNLDLTFTGITDAGLMHLAGLNNMRLLALSNTGVTDAGLVYLKGMTSLGLLNLKNTGISDAGLVHLSELTKLTYLSLSNTKITDLGLKHLNGMNELQSLNLSDTEVTQTGIADLKQSLPNCKVRR